MEVCSAVSGERLACLDPEEFEGKSVKSVKSVKQCLAAKFGITRFRQELLEEGSDCAEVPDDEVFASTSVKVQLVILDFWPPDKEQDQQLVSASRDNNAVAREKLLQRPRSPHVIDDAGQTLRKITRLRMALRHLCSSCLRQVQTNMRQTQMGGCPCILLPGKAVLKLPAF